MLHEIQKLQNLEKKSKHRFERYDLEQDNNLNK